MRITFLGTSHGVPSKERYCSATLVEVNGSNYLIDCGAPVAELLIKNGINFSTLKSVFITHSHGDHTYGLSTLCSLASWYFRKSDFDVYFPEKCTADAFEQLITVCDKIFNKDRIRFKTFEAGVVLSDENIKVTAIATKHMNNGEYPSFAFMLEAEGKRVFFTGDLYKDPSVDFPSEAKQLTSELIICEMAHFSSEAILPIITQCPTKRIYFNHIYYDYEKSLAAIKDADQQFEQEIIAVNDGDVFEI